MQHKTHTDHPSKNKDQQNQNQNNSNPRTSDEVKGKSGTQRQQNMPGSAANNNQQGDRSQSK